MPEPRHQKIQFNGYSESFLFENVEDKLKIINEAFELLESLTKFKISWKIRCMINFSNAWQLAGLQKKVFFGTRLIILISIIGGFLMIQMF